MKRSMLNKCLGKALFFILFTTVFVTSLLIVVRAPGTVVKVDPPSKTVEQGVTFTIDILVTNVTNLFTWQIKLQFDPTILQCDGASYPPDHIFAGKPIVPVTPVIDNVRGTVLHGCSLLGGAYPVSGDGKLCTIEFHGIKAGSTSLQFLGAPTSDTYLLNYDMDTIPMTVEDGSVTVQPTTKPPSQISIDVNPASVFVSETVTISGRVLGYKDGDYTDPRQNVDVTILKNSSILVKVKTNSEGYYEYVWRTIGTTEAHKNDVGISIFKARWDGDDQYQSATSDEKTATVQNAGPMIYIKWVYPTGEHHPTAPPEDLYLHNFSDPTSMYSGPNPRQPAITQIVMPFNYTLYILVSNVSDLYAWRFKFYVSNSSLARCDAHKIWIPPNGVAANIEERKVEARNEGYDITVAATLTSPPYSVSGVNDTHTRIGILCAINFTSILSKGTFTIEWFPENILLKDSTNQQIPYRIEYFSIPAGIGAEEVISTRKSTTISLDANPKEVKRLGNVTLSGKIEPAVGDIVDVTISFANGTQLAKVKTVAAYNNTYVYIWTVPNATGQYKLKASWEGNVEYEGDVSDEVTVTVVEDVGKGGVDYTPYIIIIVVIVVIVGVAVYFKKFRKPPKIPVEEESA